MHSQCTAVGIERGLLVSQFLHDRAKRHDRLEMLRFERQRLPQIGECAPKIFLDEVDHRALVPTLGIVRIDRDHRIQDPQCEIGLLVLYEIARALDQQIYGRAARIEPNPLDVRGDPLRLFGSLGGFKFAIEPGKRLKALLLRRDVRLALRRAQALLPRSGRKRERQACHHLY
jgi:hypothetical protein